MSTYEKRIVIPTTPDGPRLAGTVCFPEPGRCQRHTLVLLPGSGPQDRDQTVAGHATFRSLAEQLADRGFTTLRCDDRGVGESDGDYLAIDAETLLTDVLRQIEFARQRLPDHAFSLLGHSQGALFALRAAEHDPQLGAAVLLGASLADGLTTMLRQRRIAAADAGMTDEDEALFLAQSEALFELIEITDDEAERRRRVRAFYEAQTEGMDDEEFADVFGSRRAYIDFATDDSMEWEVRELLRSRPADHLARLSCPVLAWWGDRDRHVDAHEERRLFLASARGAGVRAHAEILPGLNHLFQRSETGAIETYADDGDPMQPPLAARIAEALLAR